MWKILAQKAEISSQYKPENYKELIAEVVKGRTGGSFAKFVQEQNPQFDLSLLKDLGQSVEAERKTLVREEKLLLDYNQHHRNIVRNRWKRYFLSADQIQEIDAQVITSGRSKSAIETGEDNDTKLF